MFPPQPSRPFVVALAVGLVGAALAAPAALADHNDGTFDQPVWFEWSKTELDVLIVPPAHGQLLNVNGPLNGLDPAEATPLNSYLAAVEAGIAAWEDAIDQFGPAWLANDVEFNVYVLGRDVVPVPALTGPEIIIAFDETMTFILGITFNTRPCISINAMFLTQSFTYEDMFSVSAHEFGHCLGLDHIEDDHPNNDLMDSTYRHNVGNEIAPLHCPSNLNVAGLVGVFADAAGQPGGGQTGEVAVSSYQTVAC